MTDKTLAEQQANLPPEWFSIQPPPPRRLYKQSYLVVTTVTCSCCGEVKEFDRRKEARYVAR